MSEFYTDDMQLAEQVAAITEDVPHLIANLANVSAVIYAYYDRLNWAGFYLYEGGKLVLGPFQVKTACIEIPLGKGVCGTAAQKNETVVVKDVHEFPGHIACDSASNSEIVIPVHKANGELFGVLDIDSPVKERFTDKEREELEAAVKALEKTIA